MITAQTAATKSIAKQPLFTRIAVGYLGSLFSAFAFQPRIPAAATCVFVYLAHVHALFSVS